MRLLIAGGSSFLGRNLLAHAGASDLEITATYHMDEDFPAFVGQLAHPVAALRCDLLNSPLDASNFDACLYLAGNRAGHGAGKAELVPLNTVGLAAVFERFRGRIVFLSSGAVYEGAEGPVSPASRTTPISGYAISKLAGEDMVRAAFGRGALEGFAIIRFYYAFGPHEPASRLVPRLFARFAGEGARDFTVAAGAATRMQPMYVRDVVDALLRVVAGPMPNAALDLCGNEVLTVSELVREAALVCGVETEAPSAATPPQGFYSSAEAFRTLYRFTPQFDLNAGLGDYLRWWRHEVRMPAA